MPVSLAAPSSLKRARPVYHLKYPRVVAVVCPGQLYDVLWEARGPGKWLLHCHINHHTTNNNVETEGGGGLMLIIEVTE
jgi:FtsP/CotA-like multicopper oxidase with cupredoxin domain